jgi:hypothetical protein
MAIMANDPQWLKPFRYGFVTAMGVVAIGVTAHALGQFWVIAIVSSPALPIFVLLGLHNARGDSWLWIVIPAIAWGLFVATITWFCGTQRTPSK